MIEIITQDNKIRWNSTINKMEEIDFYFFNNYNNESSILINFEHTGYNIVLPLIIRKIPSTKYFDATSVYGYCGPLSSKHEIPNDIIILFNNELQNILKEMDVVSVFSRLHPLMNQEELLKNIGDVVSLGETVSIDLTLSLEKQRSQYRKRLKSRINKLKRSNLYIYQDEDYKYIDEFIELYHENMERVNAESMYFFDREYFENLFLSDDMDARLFFVKEDDKFICGGIFVYTNGIIQYHLSGTKFESIKKSPLELLIDHIRITGTEQGFTNLHLGGGVGSQDDSLFHFKAGFSNDRNTFKVWKYIVNEEVYNNLKNEFENKEDVSYFPIYRPNVKQL